MIKAIILDVDGVIVGERKGYNFPLPHPEVMERLRTVRQKGIPISLCTAKPYYAIKKIITGVPLNNLHISLAGAVISDPIDKVVTQKHVMKSEILQSLVAVYLKNKTYVEVYALDNYFVQADYVSEFTKQRVQVLQQQPVIVESLSKVIAEQEIVKVMPIAENKTDSVRLAKLFEPFKNDLTLSWTIHPFTMPHEYGNVTAPNISKRQAVSIVANSLRIKPMDILGVGDGLADWQFIELCGYKAAMGNASEELKQLVTSHDNSYIGASVNDHGILDIFDHYKL